MRKYFKYIVQAIAVIGFSAAIAQPVADLFRHIENDDVVRVQRLLQTGLDANARHENGQVALVAALHARSPEVTELLLRQPGVDVNQTNRAGETPLMMAALRGELSLVQRLLARGAQVNREGWTPLHYAASGPEPRLVALLLAQGAELEARAPNGNTPLMMAARYGAIDSATLLLERGANPRLRNHAGADAVDYARSAGHDTLADRMTRQSSR